MMKFISLFLAIMSVPAFGQGTVSSTCIWQGTVAACLPADGLLLSNQRDLRLGEASGSGTNYVALQAPATLGSDITLTLPSTAGNNLEFLQTNGSGTLTWAPALINPMTTRGDMIRAGASGVPERFSAVTDNRVVRGDGTDVVLGQIDDTGFFTSGAQATDTSRGVVSREFSSGEGDIGTITNWASPGSKKYRWNTVGGITTFSWYISSSGGSTSTNTSVFFFPFPSGVPLPVNFSNQLNTTESFVAAGSSMITNNNSTGGNSEFEEMTALGYNGSVLKVYVRCAASAKALWAGSITYRSQ